VKRQEKILEEVSPIKKEEESETTVSYDSGAGYE